MSFEEAFARQLEFNRRIFADRNLSLSDISTTERMSWTKEFVLHAEGELHEFLRETNWKMHRIGNDPVSRSNLLEEWVDVFKYLLGLAQIWEFAPEELLAEFDRKTAVVEYKYSMQQRLRALSHSRIESVAVDIDGVLNDYPKSYLNWLHYDYNLESRPSSLSELREIVGFNRYHELKDFYRESGAKRKQRVRTGAKELLDGLRANGFSVVLISKRPFWRFSRIYADTLEWLDANGLRHDAVLFHPEKHRKIVEDFPDVVAVVEDDPVVANELVAAGKRVILVDGEINSGVEVDGVERVSSPDGALALISVPLSEEVNRGSER